MEEMRKIVQVAIIEGTGGLTALCNDGTLWYFTGDWHQYPDIPQPWEEKESEA